MTDNSDMVVEGEDTQSEVESTDVEETNTDTEVDEVESSDTEGDEGGEPKLTEKGTKLDPNPQSAVHQELANARRQIQQMEGVLTDPILLKRFAEQNGMTLTEAKAEIKEEQEELVEEFKPDQFKTAEDVAKALNTLRSTTSKTVAELKAENARLRDGYKGINSSREADRIVNTMRNDIAAVQEKYPELNPKSPEYNKDLEQSIGELYQELDYDPTTKAFRGKVSVAKIADKVMSAAKVARKQGSKKAQTDVKVKQAGKVTSGKSNKTGAEDSSNPGTSIAQKIAKAYGK